MTDVFKLEKSWHRLNDNSDVKAVLEKVAFNPQDNTISLQHTSENLRQYMSDLNNHGLQVINITEKKAIIKRGYEEIRRCLDIIYFLYHETGISYYWFKERDIQLRKIISAYVCMHGIYDKEMCLDAAYTCINSLPVSAVCLWHVLNSPETVAEYSKIHDAHINSCVKHPEVEHLYKGTFPLSST